MNVIQFEFNNKSMHTKNESEWWPNLQSIFYHIFIILLI